jgi:HAMP domain-containing protein
MRSLPRLRLAVALILFCIVVVVISWGTMLPLLIGVSRATTERQNTEVLVSRGTIASVQLEHVLNDEWYKLQNLVPFITRGETPDALRERFNTVKATNAHSTWIGFADTSGKVVVASGGVLEGESVLQRPWFSAGIGGPFAGDKHEALLLARFLAPLSNEPLRLIDMAMPARRDDGTLAGVVGMHIDWYWVRDFLRTFNTDDGIDLMLVSRARDVLAGPPDLEGMKLSVPSVLAAAQGVRNTDTEAWPDGKNYLVSVVPITTYRDVPSFGWSLIIRQRADTAYSGAQSIISHSLPVLLAILAALLVLALVVGRMLAGPLVRLAAAATEMAHGHFAAPVPDERRYREAAVLSSALARLQSMAESEMSGAPVVRSVEPESTAA